MKTSITPRVTTLVITYDKPDTYGDIYKRGCIKSNNQYDVIDKGDHAVIVLKQTNQPTNKD
jgi:hypothetical protein